MIASMARKTTARRKNPAAVALGKLRAQYPYDEALKARWEGVPPEERSRQLREVVRVRWRRYRATKRQRSA
jgi:hypothetical protein